MSAAPAPGSIAVVVPTRDRPAALGRCLRALATQTAEVEVIVVDDGSRDPDRVAAAVGGLPRARLLRLTGAGPAAARNAGVAAARSEVVCFTDDDCEPAADWAARLAAAARDAGGAASGQTVAAPGSRAAARASQAIIDHLQLDSLEPGSGQLGFAPSCNLALLRVRAASTPFDPSFRLAAGEDRDLSRRLAAAGAAPRYEPGALVVHRLELGAVPFLARQFRYGRGAVGFRRAGGRSKGADAGFQLRLLRRAAARGPSVAALVALGQVATLIGAGFEVLARALKA